MNASRRNKGTASLVFVRCFMPNPKMNRYRGASIANRVCPGSNAWYRLISEAFEIPADRSRPDVELEKVLPTLART